MSPLDDDGAATARHEDRLGERAAAFGALAEPVRRALYGFVVDHDGPVSRDQAAAGVGVARHTAKFHLDRLVADGLLEATFRRLSGRTGPGAGRPAKLYQRAPQELAVSVPERHYDVAGALMAAAIDRSVAEDIPVGPALAEIAADRGRQMASDVAPGEGGSLDRAAAVLSRQGYEPRVVDGRVVLRNCPFHALAAEHTELVCGMNLALLEGFAREAGAGALTAHLAPAPGRCCVVLTSP